MILVVGGAGYIGSHVNKELTQRGYDTVVYDNLICGHKEAVKYGTFEYGDISDVDRLESIFKKYEIETVIDFAAFAYVGESVLNPSKYYRNNVANTLNVLDVMQRNDVNKIVFSSTCATYGQPKEMPIKEEFSQNPINPYGKSKLMVEKILEDYETAYGIHSVCLRYFNAAGDDFEGEIGESHNPETHIIPIIIDAALGKRGSVSIYGNDYDTKDGTCIRDYIHVLDLADAHIKAMEYLMETNTSNRFNLGTGKGTSILELLETASFVIGKNIRIDYAKRRKGDPAILIGSNSKARDILRWEPMHSSTIDIISSAWNWHRNPLF